MTSNPMSAPPMPPPGTSGIGSPPIKKKRKFYYYALVFEVEFEHDEDIVYFAFS